MTRLYRAGRLLVIAGVLAGPLVSVAGGFLMSAGTDETWILMGVRGLVEHGRLGAGSPYRSVHSTGGVYTLGTALLHAVSGGRLEVIRLFAVLSLIGLLVVLHRWAGRLGLSPLRRWLLAAGVLAVPGTLALGAQAHGTLAAVLLLILGCAAWGDRAPASLGRRLVPALLLGTAAATRLDCVFALVAPLLAALLPAHERRVHVIDAAWVLAGGALVFLAEFGGLWLLSTGVNGAAAGASFGAAGQAFPLGYLIPLRLGFWEIGQGFLPLLLAVLATVGWILARPTVNQPRGLDAWLVFGWVAWLAWLTRAPIPHLRYLWPALSAFYCVGLFSLARLLPDSGAGPQVTVALGVALLAQAYLHTARIFLHGEADIVSWEQSRETRQSAQYGPFKHRRFQRAMARQIQALPADQPVATIGFNTALTFLTRRPVLPIETYLPGKLGEAFAFRATDRSDGSPGATPRWLLITPFVNRYPIGYISPRLHHWIEASCQLQARQGPYLLYRIVGPLPASADVFALDRDEPALPLTAPP
jgi:hypothetical protein